MGIIKRLGTKLIPIVVFSSIGFLFALLVNEKAFEEVFILVSIFSIIGYYLHMISLELEYELTGKIQVGKSEFKKSGEKCKL